MKALIWKTVLAIIIGIVLVMAFIGSQYLINQEFASMAASQLNDDSAYVTLKTINSNIFALKFVTIAAMAANIYLLIVKPWLNYFKK